MTDWKKRIQRVKKQQDADTKVSAEQDAADNASQLARQKKYSAEIANNALCDVLRQIAEVFDDYVPDPVIIHHDNRTLGVEAHLNAEFFAVNIHSLTDGNIRIAVFGGPAKEPAKREALDEKIVEVDSDQKGIRDWFGDTIAKFYKL